MPDKRKKEATAEGRRIRLTVQLSEPAYYAINEIQRQHRLNRRKAVPIWKVIDAAVRAYAKEKGVRLKT